MRATLNTANKYKKLADGNIANVRDGIPTTNVNQYTDKVSNSAQTNGNFTQNYINNLNQQQQTDYSNLDASHTANVNSLNSRKEESLKNLQTNLDAYQAQLNRNKVNAQSAIANATERSKMMMDNYLKALGLYGSGVGQSYYGNLGANQTNNIVATENDYADALNAYKSQYDQNVANINSAYDSDLARENTTYSNEKSAIQRNYDAQRYQAEKDNYQIEADNKTLQAKNDSNFGVAFSSLADAGASYSDLLEFYNKEKDNLSESTKNQYLSLLKQVNKSEILEDLSAKISSDTSSDEIKASLENYKSVLSEREYTQYLNQIETDTFNLYKDTYGLTAKSDYLTVDDLNKELKDYFDEYQKQIDSMKGKEIKPVNYGGLNKWFATPTYDYSERDKAQAQFNNLKRTLNSPEDLKDGALYELNGNKYIVINGKWYKANK